MGTEGPRSVLAHVGRGFKFRDAARGVSVEALAAYAAISGVLWMVVVLAIEAFTGTRSYSNMTVDVFSSDLVAIGVTSAGVFAGGVQTYGYICVGFVNNCVHGIGLVDMSIWYGVGLFVLYATHKYSYFRESSHVRMAEKKGLIGAVYRAMMGEVDIEHADVAFADMEKEVERATYVFSAIVWVFSIFLMRGYSRADGWVYDPWLSWGNIATSFNVAIGYTAVAPFSAGMLSGGLISVGMYTVSVVSISPYGVGVFNPVSLSYIYLVEFSPSSLVKNKFTSYFVNGGLVVDLLDLSSRRKKKTPPTSTD